MKELSNMGLIDCKECGAKIGATARACPQCGAVVASAPIWPWIVGIPIALVGGLLLYGATIPEYEQRAREVRRVCEQLAPTQKDVCQRNFEQAIAEGKRGLPK